MTRPTLWNRFLAVMSGEVTADTLEAYRRASLAVYDSLDHCEAHRASARKEEKNAWTLDTSTQAELLCTWNAFVLQTLGDRFLEADYAASPETRGFVPPVTADQILQFYSQVEEWLNRAQQAHYNPDYELDLSVPAELPPWSRIKPCPETHLLGMLEAMRAIGEYNQAALTFLKDSPPDSAEHKKEFNAISQLAASAKTKARYADEMMNARPSREVRERVEEHAKIAIEQYYLLGQLLAMPSLAAKKPVIKPAPKKRKATPKTKHRDLPTLGEKDFDPWCLTDPESLSKWREDPAARKAVMKIWELDPNIQATLEIKAEIDDAFERGDIDFAVDRYGKKLGHFFCCPWAPVYVVKRPITIGGKRLHTLQQFVYNVSCDGVNAGKRFTREIVVGTFSPTTRFEYGDPDAGPES